MRNSLFHPSSSPAAAGPHTVRRLLGIRIALHLSGAPAPTANGDILLARYVAGQLPLSAVMPVVWQEASARPVGRKLDNA